MKKRLLKNAVAMLVLVTMLTQNVYSGVAVMASELPEVEIEESEPEIVVETMEESSEPADDAEQPAEDEQVEEYEETEVEIGPDVPSDVEDIPPTDDYVDEDAEPMPLDEDVEDENLPESVDVLDSQISGSGLDSISVDVDTELLGTGDTFRIIFTGAESAQYNVILNETLNNTNGGTYGFTDLNKEGFNIRATSDDDIAIDYNSKDGTPVIVLRSLSKNVEKSLETKLLTSKDGSPISAVKGEGYDSISLKLDASELSKKTKYTLYVETEAEASVNGDPAKDGIKGLDSEAGTVTIAGLDQQEFTAYVIAEEGNQIISDATIEDADKGIAAIKITEPEDIRVKKQYVYEDSKVYVTATLEFAEAVPDDAEFVVTPVTSGAIYEAYMDALKAESNEDIEYTEENTLLYDIAFLVDKVDEETGEVIKGEKVEFEPEVGSVKISVNFKKSQLSEDLGAASADEIIVNHLPLDESIKESVDKTLDAVDITADDISVETVEAKIDIDGSEDQIDFSLEDFSLVGFTAYSYPLSTGAAYNYQTILGNAIYFGVVVDEFEKAGHSDSNVAANKLLVGGENITLGAYTGSNNPGINVFADFGTNCSTMQVDGGVTYTSNAGMFTTTNNGRVVQMPKTKLDKFVDDLQEHVYNVSTEMAKENSYVYTKPSWLDQNNVEIDLTELPGGTYYFNGPSIFQYPLANNGIKINGNQTVVFNFPASGNITLNQFKITIDGTSYDSAKSNSSAYEPSKHIVFNMPNATSVTLGGGVVGIFIAPKATEVQGSTSSGWLIAKKFKSNGEWHCVFGDMPQTVPTPADACFQVKKILVDNEDETDEFEFTLYEAENSNYFSGNGSGATELGKVYINSYVDNEGTASFEPITYTSAGTHYYVIRETQKNGWESDHEYVHIKVVVTENVSETPIRTVSYEVSSVQYFYHFYTGTRTPKDVNNVSSLNEPFEFVNTMKQTPGHYEFKGTKTFKDGKWPKDGKYTIRLVGLDNARKEAGNWVSAEAPMPSGWNGQRINDSNSPYNGLPYMDIEVDAANPTASFGSINYPYATPWGHGTVSSTMAHGVLARCYMYKMFEVVPSGAVYKKTVTKHVKMYDGSYKDYNYDCYEKDGVIYDPVVQRIKVWVNQVIGGADGPRVVLEVNGATTDLACEGDLARVSFTNEYITSGTETLGGAKTMTGRKIKPNEFTATITKSTAYSPKGAVITDNNFNGNSSKDAVITIDPTNEYKGTFDFGTFTYTEPGTYSYTVKEKSNSNGNGVVNDTRTYKVVITATDNNKGSLSCSKKIYLDDVEVDKIAFDNKYEGTASIVLKAQKKLTGRNITANDGFTFVLYKAANANDAQGTEIDRKTVAINSGDATTGVATFTAQNFTQTDVGTPQIFYIREAKGSVAGVTYSDEVYKVVVDLASSDTAELNKTVSFYYMADETAANAQFVGSSNKGTSANEFMTDYLHNTYNANGEVSLKVQKIFDSNVSKTFEFELKKADGTLIDTISVPDAGTAEFKSTTAKPIPELKYQLGTNHGVGSYTYKINEKLPTDANGTVLATAANGYKYQGITYDPKVYTIVVNVSDAGDGTLSIVKTSDGVEKAAGAVDAEFTNDYSFTSIDATLEGTKELTGAELSKYPNAFNFTVEGYGYADGETVTNDNNGKILFKTVTYNQPGTYEYTINEVIPEGAVNNVKDGITYNNVTYTATVVIEDNLQGALRVKSVTYSAPIKYVNTYNANGRTTLTAKKILTGPDANLVSDAFTFYLHENTADGTVIRTATNNGQTITFEPEIEYSLSQLTETDSQTGRKYHVFTYYMNEDVSTRINGYGYDENSYKVEVTVTDLGNGTFDIQKNYQERTEDEYKGQGVVFVNTYTTSGDKEIPGTKVMNGRKVKTGDDFRIDVKKVSAVDTKGNAISDPNVTNNETDIIMSAGIDKMTWNDMTGSYKFNFHYDQAGTYVYTIDEYEGSNADKNMQYDKSVWTLTMRVTDDGQGHLTATPSYKKVLNGVESNPTSLEFSNTYSVEGEEYFYAYKSLPERDLKDAPKFKFYLKDADGNDVCSSKENTNGGIVQFGPKAYDENDVDKDYVYYITEKIETNAGYTYDADTIYRVNVSVRESETAGQLSVIKTYYKGTRTDKNAPVSPTNATFDEEHPISNPQAADATFTNHYNSTGSITITAKKELDGRELTEGLFKFRIALPNSASDTYVAEASNAADGNITFTINYDQDDFNAAPLLKEGDDKRVIKYEIYEVNEGKDGVIYDPTIYYLTVTLDDNGRGTINTALYEHEAGETDDAYKGWLARLVAKIKKAITRDEIVFINGYESSGSVHFTAHKTLDGLALAEDMFTFKLSGKDTAGNDFVLPKTNKKIVYEDGTVDFGYVDFGTINYTQDDLGTYTYTVTEDKTGPDGVVYSEVVYTATVTVSEADTYTGVLNVSTVITYEGSQASSDAEITSGTFVSDASGACVPDAFKYQNKYVVDETSTVIEATKQLRGKSLTDNLFTFELTADDGSKIITKTTDDDGNTIYVENDSLTAHNVDGKVTFDEIWYQPSLLANKVGDKVVSYETSKTVNYTITELAGNADNDTRITNDINTTRDVTVTVSQLGGHMTAVSSSATTKPNFVNNFDNNDSLTLGVKKTVNDGKYTYAGKEFTFKLTGTDIKVPYTVTAKNDGTEYYFAPIPYSLEGIKQTDGTYRKVYNYVIEEVSENNENDPYTYSQEKYTVDVIVTSDGTSGNLEKDVTITKIQDKYGEEMSEVLKKGVLTVDFDNDFVATGHAEIPGTKTLIGRKGKSLEAGEFTFILKDVTDPENPVELKRETNASEENGGAFKFSYESIEALNYDETQIGNTYYYTVEEYIPAEDAEDRDQSIRYVQTLYNISIEVKDETHDGHLTTNPVITKVVEGNDVPVDSCDYTNYYETSTTIPLTATKLLEGKKLEDGMFTFTVTDVTNRKKTEVVATGTNKGTTVVFDPEVLSYDQGDIGYHYYKITEDAKDKFVCQEADGYDVTVHVYVDSTNNSLVAKTEPEIDFADLVFHNTFTSEDPVLFEGSKFISNYGKLTDAGTYTILLTDEKDNVLTDSQGNEYKASINPTSDNTSYRFKDAASSDDEPYTFKYTQDDLKFTDESGKVYYEDSTTITYKVYEQNRGQTNKGVTNSDVVYTVTVTLSYDDENNLQAVATTDAESISALDFTNTFETDGELVLRAYKTITGKSLVNGAYTFTLTDVTNAENPVLLQTTTNNGREIVFDHVLEQDGGIQYSTSDVGNTYTYEIRETASTDGSTIDSVYYQALVTIGTDEDNNITKSVRYRSVDGEDISEFTDPAQVLFTNTYTATGKLNLGGKKIMVGRSLIAGDFRFRLQGTDGTDETITVPAVTMDETSGKAEYAFNFTQIDYDQDILSVTDAEGKKSYKSEEVIYYTVTEEGTVAGVANSDQVYTVKVTITDNGDGTLNVADEVKGSAKTGDGDTKETLLDTILGFFNRGTDKAKTDIEFINTYSAEGSWRGEGYKALIGDDIENRQFSFIVKDVERKYSATVSNAGHAITLDPEQVKDEKTGKYLFKYNYDPNNGVDDLGEHTYKITEVNGDKTINGLKYDDMEYTLVINVDKAEGGNLTTELVKLKSTAPAIIEGINASNYDFTFKNEYSSDGKVKIDGTKAMKGRELTSDDHFDFTIVEIGKPENKKTVPNVGKDIVFSPDEKDGVQYVPFLNYTLNDVGTHKYNVSEELFTSDGVKSDTTNYIIEVKVSENEPKDGKLNAVVASVLPLKEGSEVGTKITGLSANYFQFTNEYKASAKVEFVGKKHLKRNINLPDITGSEVSGFTFSLLEYENKERTGGSKQIATATSYNSGDFTFGSQSFTQEDLKVGTEYKPSITKYYRVKEVAPSNGEWSADKKTFTSNGITYDLKEYNIDVTISSVPNSDKLNVEAKYSDGSDVKIKEGTDNTYVVGGLEFTNVKPEYTELSGTKFWDDGVADASSRPDVIVDLYSSVKGSEPQVAATYTIKAPSTTYSFTHLPVLDEAGNQITYSVKERPIDGYYQEQVGNDFYNRKGDIFINKFEAGTSTQLAGATLAILDKNGNELERWVSGTTSHKVKVNLQPGESYILREIEAPRGYNKAPDVKFTVNKDVSGVDPQIVEMYDPRIIGSVRLHKMDAATRESLSGAEFALYREDGTRVYASGSSGSYKYSETSSNGRFMVNSRGELEITGLCYGTYYFEEIAAPAGYSLNPERLSFSIIDSDRVVEVSFYNSKVLGSVTLRKMSADGSRSLGGAVFELYVKSPTSVSGAIASTIYGDVYYRVGSYTTNSDGYIEVGDLAWDDYYFIEVQAPDGYQINRDTNGDPIVYTFRVDGSTSTSLRYDLGRITNDTTPPDEPETPPTILPDTGRRIGGVLSGVLGVRAAPTSGVLGERVGPVTGDAANIALWLVLLAACIGTIVAMFVMANRRNKRNMRPRAVK